MLSIASIDMIPEDLLAKSQITLSRIKESINKYSIVEQSEAFEIMGICQYFNGQYRDAMVNLEMSIKGPYEAIKPPRQLCYIKILLGGVHFRFGNLDKADTNLKASHALATKLKIVEYSAVSLSNLAIVSLRQRKYQAAMKYSREAVEVISESCAKTSPEYINHCRVLLSIYLKSGELTKAEVLLSENIFPEKERGLLVAGLKYMSGQQTQALSLVLNSGAASQSSHIRGSPRHAHGGGLPTTFEEDVFLEDTILQAMVSFNKSVLTDGNEKSVADAAAVMKTCVQRITQRRSEDDEDPFIVCDWDKFPEFLPFDVYLYPVVVLAAILVVKAENALLSAHFNSGALLQSGIVTVDGGKVDLIMNDIYQYFNDAIEMVYSAVPHYKRADALTEQRPGEFVLDDSLDSINDSNGLAQIAAAHTNEMEHNDTHDIPDVSIMKESALNFLMLSRMKDNELAGFSTVAAAASKILKSNYEISLSNRTGEIIYLPDAYTKRVAKPTTDASSKAPKNKPFNEKCLYKATAHDQSTVLAEIMPSVEIFGRDDVTAWIQWALAMSGGTSMGMLGLPCPHPLPDEGFPMETIKKEQPPDALLKEVRNRLLMVEGKLLFALEDEDEDEGPTQLNSSSTTHLSSGGGSSSNRLASRFVICTLLLKVSAQLNMKKETLIHLGQVTSICDQLKSVSNSRETAYYCTVAARLKLDYEEWNYPPNAPDDAKMIFFMDILLPMAKGYVAAAETIPDINFKKDAFKKIINVYTSIGRISLGSGPSSMSSEPTMDELDRLSEAEIHAMEKANASWLRKFAKLRALMYFRKMKALRIVDSGIN